MSLHDIPKEKPLIVFTEDEQKAILAWNAEQPSRRLRYKNDILEFVLAGSDSQKIWSDLHMESWISEYNFLLDNPNLYPEFKTLEWFSPDMVDYE